MKRVTPLLVLGVLLRSSTATAGGLEIPDNGTEALGRGAAFTAKADDGTALEYNVAGFAQQRGTRLLLDTNLWFSSYSFQRAGTYPDDPTNPLTPWGGTPFPKVQNQGGVFVAPFAAFSTDFGYFDRWTFAVGVFGPSSVGNRTYPYSLGFAPSPARYDVVQNDVLVAYPTAAVSVRALPWLDVGVALHLVYSSFDISTTSLADAVGRGTAAGQCANVEYQPCDARTRVQTTGLSGTASIGALVRPTRDVVLGLNVRGPADLNTSGNVTTQAPRITPDAGFQPSHVTFDTKLPAVVHLGARYIFRDHEREAGDVEVDGTYEAWHAAQGDGPHVTIPALAAQNPPPGVDLTNIAFVTPHHYYDSWSVRVGGAYQVPLGRRVDGRYAHVLTLRAGSYYDAPASEPDYMRLDFDTLPKIAGTLGAGLEVPGFTLNVAYAEIFDVSRTVLAGGVAPVNGAQHGASVDPTGAAYPAVNDGAYSGHSRVLSLGVTVRFDGMLGPRRD
ncbi:MAG TPA: outer membrane protein transport protein [Polyangiaceae bacterium]